MYSYMYYNQRIVEVEHGSFTPVAFKCFCMEDVAERLIIACPSGRVDCLKKEFDTPHSNELVKKNNCTLPT